MLIKKACRTAWLYSLYISLCFSNAGLAEEQQNQPHRTLPSKSSVKPPLPKPHKLLRSNDIGYVQELRKETGDFPIPMPPKTEIVSAHQARNADDKRTVRLCLHSEKSQSELYDWYKQTLSADGWKIKERTDKLRIGNFLVLDLTKGEVSGHITFLSLGEKTPGTSVIAIAVGI